MPSQTAASPGNGEGDSALFREAHARGSIYFSPRSDFGLEPEPSGADPHGSTNGTIDGNDGGNVGHATPTASQVRRQPTVPLLTKIDLLEQAAERERSRLVAEIGTGDPARDWLHDQCGTHDDADEDGSIRGSIYAGFDSDEDFDDGSSASDDIEESFATAAWKEPAERVCGAAPAAAPHTDSELPLGSADAHAEAVVRPTTDEFDDAETLTGMVRGIQGCVAQYNSLRHNILRYK